MKVAIIGADGQLGTDLALTYRERGHEVVEFTIDTFNVTNSQACRANLEECSPELVINTAAYHNVEKCEADPLESFRVNAFGPRDLANLSNELDFALVHISTDYVFDGKKGSPYWETDLALPLNVYGNSKLAGEIFVRNIAERHFVVRLSGLFGRAPCMAKGGLNFVQLMLKLARERGEVKVVNSEALAPTHTLEAARNLEVLTNTSLYGLYHMVSRGNCTWYDFAERIFELSNTPVKLRVASAADFPSKTPRPAYSALENHALDELGLNQMPTWEEGLQSYLSLTNQQVAR